MIDRLIHRPRRFYVRKRRRRKKQRQRKIQSLLLELRLLRSERRGNLSGQAEMELFLEAQGGSLLFHLAQGDIFRFPQTLLVRSGPASDNITYACEKVLYNIRPYDCFA